VEAGPAQSRLGLLAAALAVLVALHCWRCSSRLSSLMRNHKEVRYLITPANSVWSLASVTAPMPGVRRRRAGRSGWTPRLGRAGPCVAADAWS
jgi:lipid A ethanolaminephosphotransferase